MQEIPSILRPLLGNDLLDCARETARDLPCHLVGGALRDAYLSLESPDFDLVVASNGLDFSRRLAQSLAARLVILGGDRFSAYRLVGGDRIIDIWDRGEQALEDDLRRRDFTINAMALDLKERTFHDPFGGLGDLRKRRLRLVTDSSLKEDPLRSLRLVRFALLLPSFSIEEKTIRSARAVALAVTRVASERIREELTRLVRFGPPARSLELLQTAGLLPLLWGDDPCSFDREALILTAKAYERFEDESRPIVGRPPDRLLCVHTIVRRSLDAVAPHRGSRLDTLVTRRQERVITRLVSADLGEWEADPRRFLAAWGQAWLEGAAVLYSELSARRRPPSLEWITRLNDLLAREGEEVLEPRPLLDGREVSKLLGLVPGPLVGDLLERVLEAQIEGRIGTREEARQLLLRLRRSAEEATDR